MIKTWPRSFLNGARTSLNRSAFRLVLLGCALSLAGVVFSGFVASEYDVQFPPEIVRLREAVLEQPATLAGSIRAESIRQEYLIEVERYVKSKEYTQQIADRFRLVYLLFGGITVATALTLVRPLTLKCFLAMTSPYLLFAMVFALAN